MTLKVLFSGKIASDLIRSSNMVVFFFILMKIFGRSKLPTVVCASDRFRHLIISSRILTVALNTVECDLLVSTYVPVNATTGVFGLSCFNDERPMYAFRKSCPHSLTQCASSIAKSATGILLMILLS